MDQETRQKVSRLARSTRVNQGKKLLISEIESAIKKVLRRQCKEAGLIVDRFGDQEERVLTLSAEIIVVAFSEFLRKVLNGQSVAEE